MPSKKTMDEAGTPEYVQNTAYQLDRKASNTSVFLGQDGEFHVVDDTRGTLMEETSMGVAIERLDAQPTTFVRPPQPQRSAQSRTPFNPDDKGAFLTPQRRKWLLIGGGALLAAVIIAVIAAAVTSSSGTADEAVPGVDGSSGGEGNRGGAAADPSLGNGTLGNGTLLFVGPSNATGAGNDTGADGGVAGSTAPRMGPQTTSTTTTATTTTDTTTTTTVTTTTGTTTTMLCTTMQAPTPSAFPYTVPTGSTMPLPQSTASTLLTLHHTPLLPGTARVVARSYGGHAWEGVMPTPLQPVCNYCWCTITITITALTGVFKIERQERPADLVPTEAHAAARLLLQATFGPTQGTIDAVLKTGARRGNADGSSVDGDVRVAEAWVRAQMKEPASLHRAYGRLRTNPRILGEAYSGSVRGPCELGSRWNRYAFDTFDIGQALEVELVGGRYVFTINGVRRTEQAGFKLGMYDVTPPARPPVLMHLGSGTQDTMTLNLQGLSDVDCPPRLNRTNWANLVQWGDAFDLVASGDTLTMNRVGTHPAGWGAWINVACTPKATTATKRIYTVCDVEEKDGGYVRFSAVEGSCAIWQHYVYMANPTIEFATPSTETTQVLEGGTEITLEPVATQSGDSSMVIQQVSGKCKATLKNGKAFIGVSGGGRAPVYYQYDSRLRLLENTLASPADVPVASLGNGEQSTCPAVPRTFVNEGSCVRRPKGTCALPTFQAATFRLDAAMLRFFYTASGQHVHAVQGLRLAGSKFEHISPCKQGVTSRWIKTDCTAVKSAAMGAGPTQVIAAALSQKTGNIRDVVAGDFVAGNGGVCADDAGNVGRHAVVTGACWQHHHPEEQNVYDFSRWVASHPGNKVFTDSRRPNPIARFAETGRTIVAYPASHPMTRWDDDVKPKGSQADQVVPIGQFGGVVDFASLDPSLQTKEVAGKVGAQSKYPSVGFEACGSRGEVGNDPSLGNRYNWLHNQVEQGADWTYQDAQHKTGLWSTVVTRSPDQLRQRVAWSLAQILVTGEVGTNYAQEHEVWAAYYDIFVQHAFGSYRDILREVSASPLMAEYLTFLGNKAHATSGGKFPDENYARELMQLFTIGLWELNADGTTKKDGKGLPISTYSNDDIMAFAKVWTGYNRQPLRANIQTFAVRQNKAHNLVDPLAMNALDRDRFPKTKLGGGHLGDHFPLCTHMPKQHFLRKGAQYRYHGPVSMLGEAHDNVKGSPNIRPHFTPSAQQSELYTALCARDQATGSCTFPAVVTLGSKLTCTGDVECTADNLRAVKIVDGSTHGYYTYNEPPCVRLLFFHKGRMARAHWRQQCVDPESADTVGTGCCTKPSNGTCPTDHYYQNNIKKPDQGDICSGVPTGSWVCPKGCKVGSWRTKYWQKPYCVTDASTSEADQVVCHLDLTALVSKGKGECTYVAEPMKFSTAQARCAATYKDGAVCDDLWEPMSKHNSAEDGSSNDWQNSCAGFQADWTAMPCRLQAQVLPSGEVIVVDMKQGSDRHKLNNGNTFRVQWGPKPLGALERFPVPDGNCAAGCHIIPARGGSCLCDIVVAEVTMVTDASQAPPAPADLRAKLLIGADPPVDFGPGPSGYTMCTTAPCLGRSGVRVHTRGTLTAPVTFDVDTIFELTDTPHTTQPTKRKPGRYLLNRVSTVHLGHFNEYVLLSPGTATSTDYQATLTSPGSCDNETMTRIATEYECAVACAALGQAAEDYEKGYFGTRFGCFITKGTVSTEDFPDSSKFTKPAARCKWNHYDGGGDTKPYTAPDYPHREGAHELCRAQGMVPGVRVSHTPCEDRGLLPVTDQAECEQASLFAASEAGQTLGRSGIATQGMWYHVPQHCSLYTDTANGDWSVHFNLRAMAVWNHTETFSPICQHKDNGKNKDKLSGFTFRNPPGFLPNLGNMDAVPGDDGRRLNPYGDHDHLLTAAEYETEALIDHLLEHDNTAPFVAYRIIQRMVTSNPSPRYVEAVALAFTTGSYGGHRYSGAYGDLGAMVAAVLLDREARSSLLDADPRHGGLREPVLKVLHLLRALEYRPHNGMDTHLTDLHTKIGQMAYNSPGVFNFYLPEFTPAGPVERAGLVSPESQLATAPFMIGFLNGAVSLIDYGLTDCQDGFGDSNWPRAREIRGIVGTCDKNRRDLWPQLSDGTLAFTPASPSHPDRVVDELALLLTAGKLGTQTRSVLVEAYRAHVAEVQLNITAIKAKEMESTPRTPTRCYRITDKAECCKYVDDRAGYVRAPNCVPGNYSNGAVCEPEAHVNHDMGHLAETCGREPLAMMSGASNDGAWTAVDGQLGLTTYTSLRCMSAKKQTDPWWQLDLGTPQAITSVIVYNRKDCCGAENDGLNVYLDGNLCAENVRMEVTHQVTRIPCRGTAQVVKMVLPGQDRRFSLCEIEISVGENARIDGSYSAKPLAEARALKHLLKLFVLAPEFHATNAHEATSSVRAGAVVAPSRGRKYKATVVVFLEGGADSFNMVVPHSGCKRPPSAEDDPTLAPRKLQAGQSCLTTPSCAPVSTKAWCKTHADSLKIGYASSTTSHSTSGRPAGCFYYTPTKSLEYNDFKDAVHTDSSMEPVCLCGAYQELGIGQCREGYYTGTPLLPTQGASLESCRALCDKEDNCKFFSLETHTCNRFTGDLNSCLPLTGATHRTYAKLKTTTRRARRAGAVTRGAVTKGTHERARRAGDDDVDHDYFAEYAGIRGEAEAHKKTDLWELKMPASAKQPCTSFGLHPGLPFLKQMYDAGDLALIANAGALTEPISLKDYKEKHLGLKSFPPGLFAHNIMQKNAKTVHAENGYAKGVLGRIMAELSKGSQGYKSAMYSMNGYQRMLDGAMNPGIIDAGAGVVRFTDYLPLAAEIANLSKYESTSIFADSYAAVLQSSLESTESLGRKLEGIELTSDAVFDTTNSLAKQLLEVAKVIKLDKSSQSERSAFYTQLSGFDTHGSNDITEQMQKINSAMEAFKKEMEHQNVWDDVTVICVSDFGRTLTSNGQGTDHGWGGNYWIMGGGVKGGQMLGQFPVRLAEFESDSNIGRGRIIPTTPWESVWNAVAQWMGVTDSALLAKLLPHAKNFKGGSPPEGGIFDLTDVFKT